MRHHLIADLPVGGIGGHRFEWIAALAREAGIDELRTVTLDFGE